MTIARKVVLSFVSVLAVAVVMISSFGFHPSVTAYADGNEGVMYTNVIDDLSKDATFDASAYPADENDYTLSLIQIAESENRELFVYVYQPAGTKSIATTINISTSNTEQGEALAYHNYPLKLLNSNGVFYKYKVMNFNLPSGTKRYYDISSIFRRYINNVDADPGHGNTVSEVSFAVGKMFTITSLPGNRVSINCVETEVVVITDKFVGFVEIERTNTLLYVAYDQLHFVAFNCNHSIDELLEADVAFNVQKFTSWTFDETTAPIEAKEKTLYADNVVTLEHNFSYYNWAQSSHTFTEIQSMTEFVSSVEVDQVVYSGATVNVSEVSKINAEEKAHLLTYNWVLNYYKTEETISRNIYGLVTDHRGEHVTDVTILRLKFVYNGVVYDLGVVDNKQTGSDIALDVDSYIKIEPKSVSEIFSWLKYVIAALIGLAAVILIILIIKFIARIAEYSVRAKDVRLRSKANKEAKRKMSDSD